MDWQAAIAALGRSWVVARMTQKIHPCCGHTFAIDGALALRAQVGSDLAIERIAVETYPVAVEVAGRGNPVTPYEAKFSLAVCLASALIHGHVGPESFAPDRLAQPRLRVLMGKVEVTGSARFAADFPAMRGAEVSIHLSDGRGLRHHQPIRLGSPEFPMSDADLSAKFLHLAEPALGSRAAGVLAAPDHGP